MPNLEESISRDLPPNHSWMEAGNAKLRYEAGKGSRPRNCFSQQFRNNWNRIFGRQKRGSR